MGQETKIEWTATTATDGTVTPGATWNPVRGCSKVSEGCRNCYAMGVAARFAGPGLPYEGLAERRGGSAQWTNRILMVEGALTLPLRWRKPRRIFVNSMSDLFHPDVPQEFIYRVSLTMIRANWHTYQVLTKRPDRMADVWLTPLHCEWLREATGNSLLTNANIRHALRHVWAGASVENRQAADERIPHLLRVPAAVRFLSYEPALGPIDFTTAGAFGQFIPPGPRSIGGRYSGAHIDWIIVGGESGPGARPFNVEWARSTVQQCREAGVACFVKQLGAKPFLERSFGCLVGFNCRDTTSLLDMGKGEIVNIAFHDRKGGDMADWPDDLRVRQFPEVAP